MCSIVVDLTIVNNRVGPDTFLAGYRISDIRLIYNAGYPVPAGYLANVRFSANYWISVRISGLKNQSDIRYTDSLNIRYPAEYPAQLYQEGLQIIWNSHNLKINCYLGAQINALKRLILCVFSSVKLSLSSFDLGYYRLLVGFLMQLISMFWKNMYVQPFGSQQPLKSIDFWR